MPEPARKADRRGFAVARPSAPIVLFEALRPSLLLISLFGRQGPRQRDRSVFRKALKARAEFLPGAARAGQRHRLPTSGEDYMVTRVDIDVQQLWLDYRARPTIDLRNQLVELYLPLVKYNAERIWSRLPEGVDLDDLISAGVFGLLDAIDAFDLERGVKFETYCVPRIRGAMLDELRTMDWCRDWCARPVNWKRPAVARRRRTAGRRAR